MEIWPWEGAERQGKDCPPLVDATRSSPSPQQPATAQSHGGPSKRHTWSLVEQIEVVPVSVQRADGKFETWPHHKVNGQEELNPDPSSSWSEWLLLHCGWASEASMGLVLRWPAEVLDLKVGLMTLAFLFVKIPPFLSNYLSLLSFFQSPLCK